MRTKILIATDVPFWRQSTGAEQRISAIVDYLSRNEIAVRTFYIAKLSGDDRNQIADGGLDVQLGSSAHPPRATLKKMRWYGDATLNQIRTWIGTERSGSDSEQELRLSDFRWPWAIDQFAECVDDFQPDCVLVEYIKLGYLLEALTSEQRSKTHCMIDTHDAIHLRCEQFANRGLPHWVSVTRDEESSVLRTFDTILAIQSQEANLFREMAPEAKTIVVGHALPIHDQVSDSGVAAKSDSALFRVGYIGSTNYSNSTAMIELLTRHWSQVGGLEHFRLFVAGNICEVLQSEIADLPSNVELVGRVDNLSAYYQKMDLMINPVEFGTGLKIKNCESLSFGVPLLTTLNGLEGMPQRSESVVFSVPDLESLAGEICRLAQNPNEVSSCRAQLSKLAKSLFSEEAAYSELLEALRS